MATPDPHDYQPALGWWSLTWRVLVSLGIAALLLLETPPTRAWLLVEIPLGILSWAMIPLRRRWPVAVAVGTTVLGAFSNLAAGVSVWATVSLATRRRWREIGPIAALGIGAGIAYTEVYPGYDVADPPWIEFLVQVLIVVLMVAIGMYVGSRRELLWTLRHRAERAEAEQELRAHQARAAERTRIAREMHDVLAHRISQISMHAGALSYREDLDATALRAGAAEIRERSHAALEDLRGVLGVLRATDTGGEFGNETGGDPTSSDAPQPTYADLPELVDRANAEGTPVRLRDDLEQPTVPDNTGRTLYRMVQEGITNARKHAPDATLRISLTGSEQEGITVEMRNRDAPDVAPGTTPDRTPGAGLGLIGLAERIALAGGHLHTERRAGNFVVIGWLPWGA